MACHGPGGFKGYNIDVSTALIMQGGTTKQQPSSSMNWGMVIGGLFATAGNVAATLIAAKKGVAANPASTSVFNTGCFQTGNFASGTSNAAQMTSLFTGLAQQGVSLYQQSKAQPQFQLFQNGVTQQKATTTQQGSSTQQGDDIHGNRGYYNQRYGVNYAFQDVKEQHLAGCKASADANRDGTITVDEVYNALDIDRLISISCGNNTSSERYTKMQELKSKMHQVIERYAGSDGKLSDEEHIEFTRSHEFAELLNLYRSSKVGAEIEQQKMDEYFNNGHNEAWHVKSTVVLHMCALNCTDEEIRQMYSVVDKYAGGDGIYTKEEYERFKSSPEFTALMARIKD